jgi:thiamine biosynthesis lipoprotein
MTDLTEVTRSFAAMNTQVNAAVCTPPSGVAAAEAALDDIVALFRDAEDRFSRFRPESELSRLNRAAGAPFAASPELFDLVTAAVEFAERTGGWFDPTILPDLVAAGYDRSFETLSGGSPCTAPAPRPNWSAIRLDRAGRIITLPERAALDLGGIGKGWTADRAAALLQGFSGFIVDAGGDIVTHGAQSDGSPRPVGIADPFDDSRDLAVLAMTGGAVCTSSTRRRRWESDGRPSHHIIDPATRRPAASGVVAATVRADDAATAEVLAKVAVILGGRQALTMVSCWPGTAGFLVFEDGTTRYSDGFTFA